MKKVIILVGLLVAFANAQVNIAGSSTVFPVAVAMADEFNIETGIEVSIVSSGSSAGIKTMCEGEVPIANASRPIRDSDYEICAENGIAREDVIELRIGLDALTVGVNPNNDWLECMDYETLASIWQENDTTDLWVDIADNGPLTEIALYGPSTASGTYVYFIEEVLETVYGDEASHTTDYFPTEDDAVIVDLVSKDENALLYVGLAYYLANSDSLKAVAIDGGEGCVLPSSEAATDGTYPLSRPLFMYVNKNRLAETGVKAYLEFVLNPDQREIITEVGYAALGEEEYAEGLAKLQ